MTDNLLIKNAHIVDPATGVDLKGDILVTNGLIKEIGPGLAAPGITTVDASGLVACPAFIDLHCHLRQPGYENKETIATGAAAAARGGFTTVCCMPNTNPPLDNAAAIGYVRDIASLEAPQINIAPIGCITKGRDGKELAEMAELALAGCIGYSDDGAPVSSSRIMLLAMQNARALGLPIIDHCEDIDLSRDGQVSEGWVAARLGLRGIPAAAEESIVARDIALASMTNARLHLTHLSTSGSVELVRQAKAMGLAVTADTTPHHLTLTEERVIGDPLKTGVSLAYDTDAKVNPPLRTTADMEALIAGINDGTLDAIATDHAPHAIEDKLCEFELAAFGISGFETAFGALMALVHAGKISLARLISCLTSGPAGILRSSFSVAGSIAPAVPADIVLLDIDRPWTVDRRNFLSMGKNTPFDGQTFAGMVIATVHHGKIAYRHDSLRISK